MPEFPWWSVVALKLAATGCVIALALVWASGHGLRRLWTCALSLAAVACLVALLYPRIDLYAYYCGALCGEGWSLNPIGVAVSSIATGAALSPPAVRTRHALKWIVGSFTAILFLATGLVRWMA